MTRLHHSLACVLLFVPLLVKAAHHEASATKVPIETLLANPSKYNKRIVSVTGYCDTKNRLILYSNRTMAENPQHPLKEAIFIKLSPEDARKMGIRRVQTGYATIKGLFEYIDTSVRKIPSKDSKHFERAVMVGKSGFGPFGVYSNQIGAITEFRPVKNGY
jgi:hypothetical protein